MVKVNSFPKNKMTFKIIIIICFLFKLFFEKSKTKVFYKFMRSSLVNNSSNTESVLKMLNLNKNDELALKYWQAGLSNECKVQIRTV